MCLVSCEVLIKHHDFYIFIFSGFRETIIKVVHAIVSKFLNVGDSVKLEVPSHLCDKFLGITTCFVFEFRHPLNQAFAFDESPPSPWCSVKANGFEAYQLGLDISKELGLFKTNHLSLIYYSYNFFDKEWKETLSQSNAQMDSAKLRLHLKPMI